MTQKNRNTSSVPATSLGFSFQDVYSLYLLLKQESYDLNLWVEGLDDIHIRDDSDHLTLYQLKHKAENLNNRSGDLWNTLGNWCQAIQDKYFSLEKTEFKLIIINKLSPNQLAYSLNKDYGGYNPSQAYKELCEIAENEIKKDSTKPKTDYEKFLNLSKENRETFVKKIEVVDKAHTVTKLDEIIPSLLHGVYQEYQKDVYLKIKGWWKQEIDKQLSNKSSNPFPLTKESLENEIANANEAYHKGSLPEDYDKEACEEYKKTLKIKEEKTHYIQQMKKVTQNKKKLEQAAIDFYLAKNKRIEWITKKLLIDNELDNYEEDLIENWGRIVTGLADLENFDVNCCNDLQKKNFGLKIYSKTEEQYVRPLREKMIKTYVKMGSYHILVDEDRLCWYPEGAMLEYFENVT